MTRRPLVLALGALARAHVLAAHTVWPDASQPYLTIDAGCPPVAEWSRAALEGAARRFPSAATWNVLRAGAVLIGPPDGVAIAAAERVLGPASRDRRLVMHVHAGHAISKALCFVFDAGQETPSAVVKAMPHRRFSGRLHDEVVLLESVRALIGDASEVADALPPPPLYAGNIGDDFVTVERLDELVGRAGRDDGGAALSWLNAFQDATALGSDDWGDADDAEVLAAVDDAWQRARPQVRPQMLARMRELLAALPRTPVPRCAVHGDFWRGNVARDGKRLRVFDWEWAQLDGTPLFDLWTYELAELRVRAAKGEHELLQPLAEGLERVRAQLSSRTLEPELALVALPAVLSGLAFRIRRATGLPDRMEDPSIRLMAATERLLGCAP